MYPPVSKDEDDGFLSPPPQFRPKFRYWLPDASVPISTVQSDIDSAASIGAGGVEFLPFYNYGGAMGGAPNGSDWETYGFGTAAFRDMFVGALETHKELGIKMDFPLGPNQGQGVPMEWGDEGGQWDLVSSTARASMSGVFEGVIPGWGEGRLVAFTSALVQAERNMSETVISFAGSVNHTWTQYTLAHDSLVEHTSKVHSSTGHVQLTFPAAKEKAYYRVFAFYERLAHHKNLEFESKHPQDALIFANGSFAVDHHSARGAQTMIDFWEKYMLDVDVLSLIQEAGNYAWEDSVELIANTTWTPTLPTIFLKKYKYSIKPYLPLLTFQQNTVVSQIQTYGSPFEALLDTPCFGTGYVNDYRSALEEGYNAYIDTIRNWVNARLRLQYSIQPAYGFPQDMTAAIAHVDIPEYESLSFKNSIDAYRQFIGTAHIAGKKIISNELGAVVLKAYSYSIPELLDTVHRAVIGGTNQIILHGQTFSENWFGTTWPGYTPFQYLFSELYSPKQPAWEHGMSDVMGYISRLQWVQRQGTAKTDVAVFMGTSRTDTDFPHVYGSLDLEENGYSYSYISPFSFELKQAYVQGGLLAPVGPAYTALVIPSDQRLTVSDVEALRDFAQAGLPVILSGGRPKYSPSGASCTEQALNDTLDQLQSTTNVYIVKKGQVAAKLAELKILPRALVDTSGSGVVYTTWREDKESGFNYAYIFNNESHPVTGNARFASSGVPYLLDAWTGERQRVLTYSRNQKNRTTTWSTTIPIRLDAGQTVIFAFGTKTAPIRQASHFKYLSSSVLGVTQPQPLVLSVKVPYQHSTTTVETTFPNGSTITIRPSPATSTINKEPIHLTNWTLTAEHWESPLNTSDSITIAAKRNTTHHLNTLKSWLDIPALQNASGIGYYETSFTWSITGFQGRDGAYIHFPNITNTLQLLINNHHTGPFDHNSGIIEITPYLVNGTNKILVIVPTTMWNYIKSIAPSIRESGNTPMGLGMALGDEGGSIMPVVDSGLLGDVVVVSYWRVEVAC
ncbi:uncharacterized protein BDV14DRAFT_191102 [Aspergillus stella-maris]|uniref:uncharacterized protein n=1 Tax=Aspergillus stella-maris TaxID=1810926 RepID=UPI003CCDB95A